MTITLAGISLVRWLTAAYQRTLGRRRSDTRKIRTLVCGLHIAYVDSILGPPAFKFDRKDRLRNSEAPAVAEEIDWIEYIYVLANGFVQVRCHPDDAVGTIAITTTSRKFHPKLEIPGLDPEAKFRLKLGRTTYAKIPASPNTAGIVIGAHRLWYLEKHWFGNPGYYQTYFVGYNDISFVGAPEPQHWAFIGDQLPREGPIDLSNPPEGLDGFRRDLAPNTLLIVGPNGEWEEFGAPVGVDSNMVRVLPSYQRPAAREVRRQQRRDKRYHKKRQRSSAQRE